VPTDLQYGFYLVAFVDVLGQRERLRQLRRLPNSEQDVQETIEILRNTAGVVLDFRESFKRCFEANLRPAGILDPLPMEKRLLAEQLCETRVQIRGFSDSAIISVFLTNDNEGCASVNGALAALQSLCGIFPLWLSSGHPIRAGVDVGLGLQIAPGEVYGPVLERAYFLEAKCAGYPRVVVGQELWDYLSNVEKRFHTTPHARFARERATACKTLLATDTDGQRILDWLGPAAKTFTEALGADVLSQAYRSAIEREQHYRLQGDAKLMQRYAQLRAYMTERLLLQGGGNLC
jgi:hypothetical protein